MPRESHLVSAILREFGTRPNLRIWRANVIAAQTADGRFVRAGTPGQADIMGILAPHGRLIGIEAKSARGKQTERQRKWQAMIERFGGLYILARSVEDVRRGLDGG